MDDVARRLLEAKRDNLEKRIDALDDWLKANPWISDDRTRNLMREEKIMELEPLKVELDEVLKQLLEP